MRAFLKRHRYAILGFLVVFTLALLFPYTGDDWDWGANSLTMENLIAISQNPNINGRYLGNLFVIVMTKSAILRALIVASVLVGIVSIIKKRTECPLYVIWFLILVTPIEIARQSIVWTSGFTNYVISSLFLLMCISSWERSFAEKNSKIEVILNGLLFLASSFFVENMTVFLLLANVGLNVWYSIKNKKVNVPLMSSLIGSILGTVLMFIQPAYHNVATGVDTYRSFGSSIGNTIYIAIYNYIFNIQKYGFFQNVFIVLPMAWLLKRIFVKGEKKYTAFQKKVFNITSTFLMGYSIYIILANLNSEWSIVGRYTYILNTLLTTVALLSTIVEMWIVYFKDRDVWRAFLPILVIVGLLGPLLIVRPIGPRNFFMIYVLEIIVVLIISKKAEFDFDKVKKYGCFVVFILALYYGSIYYKINAVNNLRDKLISEANSDASIKTIVVPKLPYEEYVYDANFVQSYQKEKYRTRYNIRPDLEPIFIDYEDWLNKIMEKNED